MCENQFVISFQKESLMNELNRLLLLLLGPGWISPAGCRLQELPLSTHPGLQGPSTALLPSQLQPKDWISPVEPVQLSPGSFPRPPPGGAASHPPPLKT